jgi:DNA modification methylase
MAVAAQDVTGRWAIYNGDCMDVMAAIPDGRVGLSVYSPPFAGIYQYSSSERDLSNNVNLAAFMEHYGFVVSEVKRVTMPGRVTCVHCMDIPLSNTGRGDTILDFSGEIIRLHQAAGWGYVARYAIWKEPLAVRNRTMMKALAHKTIVDDSSRCTNASADYMLVFRAPGENPEPIEHPVGLLEYAGERRPPSDVLRYRGWTGKQTENRYSHWIWRQYASAFWDDIRLDRVLPFREARDEEDEKHVHPLQLDVIDRAVVLWSNPGDRVLTPFMGVGSEVYGAVRAGRFGVGAELKPSYYRQAVRNLRSIDHGAEQMELDVPVEPQVVSQ